MHIRGQRVRSSETAPHDLDLGVFLDEEESLEAKGRACGDHQVKAATCHKMKITS
jgi:hypothetical protein